MLAERAAVVYLEVNLVVVRAGHLTRDEGRRVTTVRVREVQGNEVLGCHQSLPSLLLTRNRGVEVRTRTGTLGHRVNRELRGHLVRLVGRNRLTVVQAGGQTLQGLPNLTEIYRQVTLNAHVRGHVARAVTVVLKLVVVVELVAVNLLVRYTVSSNRQTVYILGNVARTHQKHVVVVALVCTANLNDRRGLLAVVTRNRETGLQPLRYLYIGTCAVVPTLVHEVTDVTILVEECDTGKVVGLLRGTRDVERVLLLDGSRPVVIQHIEIQLLHGVQLVELEEVGRGVEVRIGLVGVSRLHDVVQATILVGVQHLGVRLVRDTHRTAIRNLGSTLLTALRRHEDNTVSSACTIHGSRGILQHRDRLNHRRVEVREGLCTEVYVVVVTDTDTVRVGVTIDHIERLLYEGLCTTGTGRVQCAQVTGTTHENLRTLTRGRVTTRYRYTGHQTLERRTEVTRNDILNILRIDRGHRTGQVRLLLRTITHYDYLLDVLTVLLQNHLRIVEVRNRLGDVTQERNLDSTILRNSDIELAVEARRRTHGRTLHDDRGTNHGLSGLIHHGTLDHGLCHCREREHHRYQAEAKAIYKIFLHLFLYYICVRLQPARVTNRR